MNRPLSLAETAGALGTAFSATAAHHDATGAFPHENFKRLHEARLLALTAPIDHGGRGGGLLDATTVVGAIAEGEPSTALVLAMQYINLASLPGDRWPAHLSRRVLKEAAHEGALINALRVEPDLGTPLRGGLPATTARRKAEGWSITGRKIYSTGIPGLTWGIVWARTDEEAPRVGQFLVPVHAPGLRIEETWDPLGMRATASHDVVFEDVRIPLDYAVDLRHPEDWAVRDVGQAAWQAVLLGALYDGVARAARNWLVGFLHERKPSNLGAALATVPRLQEALGAIEERLAVNARLLRSTARDVDAGEIPPGVESNLLKVAVTENAIAAVEGALAMTGNHGVSRSHPLERHLRDVLCGRIHSPQPDTARVAAGRAALHL
ncbi:MAG: acyl-CoA dehydrogenase family protein [Janthinobacterium lividum]